MGRHVCDEISGSNGRVDFRIPANARRKFVPPGKTPVDIDIPSQSVRRGFHYLPANAFMRPIPLNVRSFF
ncbi:hypothetical protein BCEP27_20105 [Burkholderia cepacia]